MHLDRSPHPLFPHFLPTTLFVVASGASRVLQVDTINAELREMQYAVRGAVPTRAGEIEEEMAAGTPWSDQTIPSC